MLPDFHVHTAFSSDSDAEAEAQIRRGIALGMDELCITDHHDYDSRKPDNAFILDFSAYLPRLEALRGQYKNKLRLGIGVELGLLVHEMAALASAAASYEFDFVIGSSHFIDGLDPYYPDFFAGRTEREAYERYFAVTLERVRKLDCFDVLGHLDYIVRYGPNANRRYSYRSYQEYIDPILRVLIEKGKGLECNTGGFRCGLGHPNPSEDILKRYRELGGEIVTAGSDAHAPQYLGFAFDRLPGLLRGCGFRYYTVYHGRRPEFLPL